MSLTVQQRQKGLTTIMSYANHTAAQASAQVSSRVLLPGIFVALLCGVAFVHNYLTTYDLLWPAFDTQFREEASAQTFLDEGYGPDSNYLHEDLWYNPLSGVVVAVVSYISNIPAHTVVPQIGTYINLLAPLCFFLMMVKLIDPWSAMAGTAGFLFLGSPRFADLEAATYSPWFLPNNFVQALFYLGVTACSKALTTNRLVGGYYLIGTLLGLLFLGHPAPALILGCMVVGVTTTGGWQSKQYSRAIGHLSAALGTALVVSAPFLFYIGWHYKLRTLNSFPSLSPYTRLDLNESPQLIRDLISVPLLVAVAGWVIHVKMTWREKPTLVLLLWPTSAAVFLLYNYGRAIAAKRGIFLGLLVPPFHFLFYLQAAIWVGFGTAVKYTSYTVCHRVRSWMRKDQGVIARMATYEMMIVVLTGLFIVMYYPSYLARDQFGPRRETALMLRENLSVNVWEWIRRNTKSSAVFLCTDDKCLYTITAAGRKVVAMNRYFSNPFVDWVERDHDRNQMFDALKRRNRQAFDVLASKYEVSYIIWSDVVPQEMLSAAGMRLLPAVRTEDIVASGFEPVFQRDGVSIFKVTAK